MCPDTYPFLMPSSLRKSPMAEYRCRLIAQRAFSETSTGSRASTRARDSDGTGPQERSTRLMNSLANPVDTGVAGPKCNQCRNGDQLESLGICLNRELRTPAFRRVLREFPRTAPGFGKGWIRFPRNFSELRSTALRLRGTRQTRDVVFHRRYISRPWSGCLQVAWSNFPICECRDALPGQHQVPGTFRTVPARRGRTATRE